MKPLFLAQIGNQLFAIDTECVAGVGVRNDRKMQPLEENGSRYLPLPDGQQALICDLHGLAGGKESTAQSRQAHYLIVNHGEKLLALIMNGKGRLVLADAGAARPLPPAFGAGARLLVPGVLINGNDLIFFLDPAALFAAASQGNSPEA